MGSRTLRGRILLRAAGALYFARLERNVFNQLNNAVYRAGFAQSQKAYEDAYDTVFHRLDILEGRLSGRRYLFGNQITDSDVRLYVTLARFDAAYYNAFRVNRNRLVEFPNLWAYARDLYQTPGFGDTTDFISIKKHYHLSTIQGNQYKILPKSPDLSVWNEPHGREKLLREHIDIYQCIGYNRYRR